MTSEKLSTDSNPALSETEDAFQSYQLAEKTTDEPLIRVMALHALPCSDLRCRKALSAYLMFFIITCQEIGPLMPLTASMTGVKQKHSKSMSYHLSHTQMKNLCLLSLHIVL